MRSVDLNLFDSMEWVWCLWLVSAIGAGWLTVAGLRRMRWRHICQVFRDEDGAGYTLSYVMTIPFYILMLAVVLECTFLLMAKLGTVYASFVGVRTAIVWNTATTEDEYQEKTRKAAIRAFVPFASGVAGARIANASSSDSDSDEYIETYREYMGQMESDSIGVRYIRSKYRYAVQAFEDPPPEIEIAPGPSGEVWDEHITVTVTYQFPFNAPIIDRLLGERGSDGRYYYPVTSSATLPNEAPQNDKKRLGITYASPPE